jgi:deoxyadenosine/deoxycytidine kinase
MSEEQTLEDISTKNFIAVAGNIGSGKTTLTRLLGERFKWAPHYEAVHENPYLEDFYGDMERWAFNLQIFFLNHRYRAHQSIVMGNKSSIQDRSIYEDANIFAKNLYDTGKLRERDYYNYLRTYETLVESLTPPDLIIYLRKKVKTLKARISERGRSYEENIPEEYLKSLNDYYDNWISTYRRGKVLIVESDHFDFLNTASHFDELCDEILSTLDQKDLFEYQEMISKGQAAQKISLKRRSEIAKSPLHFSLIPSSS